MAKKVDEAVFARIKQLKALGLTDKVISIRLGVSERTIRVYNRAIKTQTVPYNPDISLEGKCLQIKTD